MPRTRTRSNAVIQNWLLSHKDPSAVVVGKAQGITGEDISADLVCGEWLGPTINGVKVYTVGFDGVGRLREQVKNVYRASMSYSLIPFLWKSESVREVPCAPMMLKYPSLSETVRPWESPVWPPENIRAGRLKNLVRPI